MTKNRKDSLRTNNRIVVPAKSNQLQIDLDGWQALTRHTHSYFLLEREGLTEGWQPDLQKSETNGHYHLTVTLPKPLPVERRILLQALLGSDLSREVYNFIRSTRNAPMPVVFFEKKR
jgi:hypothetical protein